MALDPTPGGASSNTYASLAEAEDYLGTLKYKDAWATATDPEKEGALRSAARKLDLLGWVGVRTSATQAMAWPRIGAVDRDGYSLDSSTIPVWLKDAQAEQALRELEEDRGADPALGQSLRVKVGPLEEERGPGARQTPALITDLVAQMVSPYLKGAIGSTVRLGRA